MDSFDRQWQHWFPENERKKSPPAPPRRLGAANLASIIIGVIILLFIIINVSKGIYTEWLWFDSLAYGSVYTTILRTKLLVFFIAAIIFAVLFLGSMVLATRLLPSTPARFWPWSIVQPIQRLLKIGYITGTAFLSLIFGLVAQGNWEVILSYLNRQPFGVSDPVFYREISFYVFSLPFFEFIRGWLTGALIITLLGTASVYLLSYSVQRLGFDSRKTVLAHIGGLLIAILGVVAWGYWLGIWELVFSSRGVVFGASYADIHAKLPAQWILIVVVIILMALIIVSIVRRNYRWPLYGLGAWIVIAIIMGGIMPALVQRFQVEPSEMVKETPYIEHNIQYTREAFGLNNVEEQPFLAEDRPSQQDMIDNPTTINNIRLWDPRPLKDTYNQLQSIRLYYDFNDVDIDRYTIDDTYKQVMLSARELSAEKLSGQAQTWVNRRLQFTHGYGLAMSPVNEVTKEGLPLLLIKDIPPAGKFEIGQPQIYFGEKTNNYVIVNTKTQEFDYPSGDDNVYGHYEGADGVNIGGFIRKFIYAWQLGDFNILISNELTTDSRILYYRNIRERVSHLAPFLKLDSDPYVVTIDGRMFWIQDAYTVTDRYPYSQPLGSGLNYIRNSVKAVIDAYNGDVTFYVTDPDDALIRTYQSIFPELFVPASQMPEALRSHIRYPEDMFNIQASVYQTYHMRDVRVFYNKEDLWAIPKEVYAGSEQTLESYYIIMRLPGEKKEEFLLMLPFTPVNKNNAIGWLAARCDGDNYGKLLAYRFPKDSLVYGPSQIENRIQQDTVITEQFALWGRGGSRIIRGNLLMIPIGNSKIYVEPVFLQADAGGLPELKRVIVAAGDQIVMEPTLKESLAAIFGSEAPPTNAQPPSLPQPGKMLSPEIADLIDQAQSHYTKALKYLKEGDWAAYGEELDALKTILDRLANIAAESKG
ncbi:UPF0182 family protein [Chloroflexota bacterium]